MNSRFWISVITALCISFGVNNSVLGQICTGGIDSIQQVSVQVSCRGMVSVILETSPSSYTLEVGSLTTPTFDTDTISFHESITGVDDNARFLLREVCVAGVDSFYGILPLLSQDGTWAFSNTNVPGQTGSGSMSIGNLNMTGSGSFFTISSPIVIPLATQAGASATTTTKRPTCSDTDDGEIMVAVNYAANTIDSIEWITYGPDNTTTVVNSSSSAVIVSDTTQTVSNFTVTGIIPEGEYTTRIYLNSGTCIDSFDITTTMLPGSDEPVVACNTTINASVDASCMVLIHSGMVLAGTSSPCASNLMDSLVAKDNLGNVISINFAGPDSIVIEDASAFLGLANVVELHSTNDTVSNTCWGNLILEDKLAPVLTCDTIKTISCFLFDPNELGDIDHADCDPNPTINLINRELITNCDQISPGNDSIIKRVIRTYTAVDRSGNVSDACTDTLDIRRIDANLNNGDTLDIIGLIKPLDYVVNNTSSPLDTTAFTCDTNSEFADIDEDDIPDPIDFIVDGPDTLYGAGFPSVFRVIGGDTIQMDLRPSNVDNPHESVAKLLESCKTVVTYKDFKFGTVGCVTKVIRDWTITEWACGQESKNNFSQLIEIADYEGPEIETAVNMSVTTNLKTCGRRMTIPILTTLQDRCGDISNVIVNVRNGNYIGTLSTKEGNFDTKIGGTLELPLGENVVIYQALDHCHNVSIDSMIITVSDETAPVMVCKTSSVVALNTNDLATVTATSLDNGTFDDCSVASLCVARMADFNTFDAMRAQGVGGILDNNEWYVPLSSFNAQCERSFSSSGQTEEGVDFIVRDDLCTADITFCCNDGGVTDMVVLKATDNNGNTNQCMVEVSVQDKRSPILHCPPSLTVDCRYDFTPDADFSLFGDLVNNGDQSVIQFPEDQVFEIEAGKGYNDGIWFGNCTGDVSISVADNRNDCGSGAIVRTFSVTANGFTSRCNQVVTVSRDSALSNFAVIPARDTTIEGCGNDSDFTREKAGAPVITEGACSLIGDAYEDLVVQFPNGNGSCLTIKRTWSIIDWCTVPAVVLETHQQQIKIVDDVDPVINQGGVCADMTFTVIDCAGTDVVTLSQVGTDQCTTPENLRWVTRLDLQNNGSDDVVLTVVTSEDSGISTAEISRAFPLGTHKITWELIDQCGNIAQCEQLVHVINNAPPTPISRTSITGPYGIVGPDTLVTIWASEYDIGSSTHPCGYEIVYSFSDTIVPSIDLHCGTFRAITTDGISATIDLQVEVLAITTSINNEQIDTTIVSSNYSSVEFVLTDPNNLCGANTSANTTGLDDIPIDNQNANITGNISTADGQSMATVNVGLLGVDEVSTNTDLDGMYAFPEMDMGISYEVRPSLNTDPLNGISTLDLVLIQKHILGLERLDTPYKIIAGDINNDRIISAIDLIELRKLILAVNTEFSNNTSWKFVDVSYEFDNPKYPLQENYPTSFRINQLDYDMSVDFVGVKIGDVNGTVNISDLLTDPRSSASLLIKDMAFTEGQTVAVPVTFSGITSMLGYQFGLSFNEEILGLKGFSQGSIPLSNSNFGTTNLNQGIVTTSWSTSHAETLEDVVFTYEFVAKKSGRLSEVISMDERSLSNEIYTKDADVRDLNLKIIPNDGLVYGEYQLMQNSPNPFSESTVIGFVLPEGGEATLTVYDVEGKVVKKYDQTFLKGLNQVVLSKKELPISSGVLIYRIESGEFTDTKEMILVE